MIAPSTSAAQQRAANTASFPETSKDNAAADADHSPIILLVEDNTNLAATAQMLLERLGYTVKQAATARQAIDLISTGDAVDLVFSDIVMPGEMNGIELAKMIRERIPQLPVVLTTGFTSAAEDAFALGFTLLQKPYPMEVLERALHDALADHPKGGSQA
jgi:two-component system NtrC family sensor kinase